MINVHLELGQLWRCPVEWCAVWKDSVSDCLGQFAWQARGFAVCRLEEYSEVFPSVDCAPGLVDDGTSSGRLWDSCGCPTVPRGRVPFGTQVSCLRGPILVVLRISGLYDEIASRAGYDIFSALARYAIVHTGIADQVERLGYISESHFPTRRDAQCAKCMWLHRSLNEGVRPRYSYWRCLWGSATSWGKGNYGSVQCEYSGWYPRFCYNPS